MPRVPRRTLRARLGLVTRAHHQRALDALTAEMSRSAAYAAALTVDDEPAKVAAALAGHRHMVVDDARYWLHVILGLAPAQVLPRVYDVLLTLERDGHNELDDELVHRFLYDTPAAA